MDHDAAADSGLSILSRAGGDTAPGASPPAIAPLFDYQGIHYEHWSSHRR
jgi:hypothetical protein